MLRGKVEKSLADTRLKQAASGHGIEWLGNKINIENAQIHQHILSAEGLQYELDQMQTVEDKLGLFTALSHPRFSLPPPFPPPSPSVPPPRTGLDAHG